MVRLLACLWFWRTSRAGRDLTARAPCEGTCTTRRISHGLEHMAVCRVAPERLLDYYTFVAYEQLARVDDETS
jgi:hypothetical protein